MSINIDHFYLLVFSFVISNPRGQVRVGTGLVAGNFLTLNLTSKTS